MNTSPPSLSYFNINCGTQVELHDAELSPEDYDNLRPVLPPNAEAKIRIGNALLSFDLSWVPKKPGFALELEISRGEIPLLLAGFASDALEARRLRGWLNLIQGTTFRCLRSPHIIWPRTLPWVGSVLMPEALELCDAHLDALGALAHTVARTWLRRRLLEQAAANGVNNGSIRPGSMDTVQVDGNPTNGSTRCSGNREN